jgi:hypothetical protein
MGAAGLQARLQVALQGQQLQHGEVGARLPRGGAGDRHPVALAGSAADRRVDRPGSRAEPSSCEGEVDALDLARLDLRLQRRVRLLAAGDDEQAAGPLVESVDDPRPLRVAAAAEDLPQLADQGRTAVGRGRVDDESGGLVDDGEGVVEVDDPQRRVSHSRAPARLRAGRSGPAGSPRP